MPIRLLYVSRGRGRGHAQPDLAIIAQLRSADPSLDIRTCSYGTGAAVFRQYGEKVLDLGLDDFSGPADLQSAFSAVLEISRWDAIVIHEEFTLVPMAATYKDAVVYLTHWFHPIGHPMNDCIGSARSVGFMQEAGLFQEPHQVRGKVTYLSDVLRTFVFNESDQGALFEKWRLGHQEKVIAVFQGSWANQKNYSFAEMVVNALDLVQDCFDRVIWICGTNKEKLQQELNRPYVSLISELDDPEQLMIISKLIITNGTYNISLEAASFGIPTITLSTQSNPIDDFYSRRLPTRFKSVSQSTASEIAKLCVDGLLTQPIRGWTTERKTLGARETAAFILKSLR